MKLRTILAVLAAAAVTATPVAAHHSHAMFDHAVEVTVTGKVAAYHFSNPHVYLYVDVPDASGAVTQWGVEMSHIRNMLSRGINASTFKEGDTITVTVNPLRNGAPGGNYTKVTAADGAVYE